MGKKLCSEKVNKSHIAPIAPFKAPCAGRINGQGKNWVHPGEDARNKRGRDSTRSGGRWGLRGKGGPQTGKLATEKIKGRLEKKSFTNILKG